MYTRPHPNTTRLHLNSVLFIAESSTKISIVSKKSHSISYDPSALMSSPNFPYSEGKTVGGGGGGEGVGDLRGLNFFYAIADVKENGRF